MTLVANTEYVVTHNLDTEYPNVQVYGSTNYVEDYTIRYISTNTVGVTSANAETVKVVVV